MEEGAVGERSFDGMANGVTEVEEGTGAGGFSFVLFDDARLDLHISRDEVGWDVLILGVEGFQIGKHRFIADRGVFDDLRESFAKLASGEGEQGEGIGDDKSRLVKGTNEVFSLRCVDARFSPDGGVDLSNDGGRDLHERDSAVENRGHETCQITHNSAAQSNDE